MSGARRRSGPRNDPDFQARSERAYCTRVHTTPAQAALGTGEDTRPTHSQEIPYDSTNCTREGRPMRLLLRLFALLLLAPVVLVLALVLVAAAIAGLPLLWQAL